ncbi:MAG: hypothetical protein JSS81_18695 [Acidobacteria bacterium]|nr:hypothetical protein [Acidobacteriota bacterium]
MNKPPAKYMGYRAADFETPWAKYFDEKMAPIQTPAREGLERSPFPPGTIPPITEAPALAAAGYAEVENGYAMENDGSIRLAILTKMPRVAPAMWDWWFGWHGCRADRYKLWHPLAHKHARWADGRDDDAYVGRTSMIEEYIGESLEKASIRFVSPLEMGFGPDTLELAGEQVFVCARVGYTNFPVDFGWLLHQVRRTADGAEMRSRFWFGGDGIEIRGGGVFGKPLAGLLRKIVPVPERRAHDLLVHCAEEMNHLARFLPELHAEFGTN